MCAITRDYMNNCTHFDNYTRIYIRNISNLKKISNYEYLVMVNAEKIADGKILNHRRSDGWQKLVKRIAEESEGTKDAN